MYFFGGNFIVFVSFLKWFMILKKKGVGGVRNYSFLGLNNIRVWNFFYKVFLWYIFESV